MRYILEHSEARALVVDESLVALADEAMKGMDSPPARVCIAPAPPAGWTALADLRVDGADLAPAVTEGGDVHRLMYTSGTTGHPKGVMLTHANLAWKNLAHLVEFGFTSDDLGLACGPLYHVGALDLTTTTLVAAGATVVIHRAFDAAAVVDELERSRVTTVWLAPAMVNAIMALPDVEQRDLSSVRVIINGGEKMPIPLIERIQRTFPSAWFADAYGLTETVSGDTFLDRDSIITKLGSVGRPCLHLELDVWDEQGNTVAPGERGEIVLRGPKVFTGYWRDEAATAKAFAGGWFHTGDIGVRDEDGYLFIVDRLKDMIVSGGENIAGSEVERVLVRARRRARGGRRGPTRRALGRGAGGVRRRARGSDGHGRRAGRALPRPAGQVQGAEGRDLHRGAAPQPVGQGAQARAAHPGRRWLTRLGCPRPSPVCSTGRWPTIPTARRWSPGRSA